MGPLVLPLLGATALFWVYHEQQHFRCASRLPLDACIRLDGDRQEAGGPQACAAFVGAYEPACLRQAAPPQGPPAADAGECRSSPHPSPDDAPHAETPISCSGAPAAGPSTE